MLSRILDYDGGALLGISNLVFVQQFLTRSSLCAPLATRWLLVVNIELSHVLQARRRQWILIPVVLIVLNIWRILVRWIARVCREIAALRPLPSEEATEEAARAFFRMGLNRCTHGLLAANFVQVEPLSLTVTHVKVSSVHIVLIVILFHVEGIRHSFGHLQSVRFQVLLLSLVNNLRWFVPDLEHLGIIVLVSVIAAFQCCFGVLSQFMDVKLLD